MTPSGSLFSPGIVLSLEGNKIQTKIYGNPPTQETLLATKVIDGATPLYMNYTFTGKVVHYLIKVSTCFMKTTWHRQMYASHAVLECMIQG